MSCMLPSELIPQFAGSLSPSDPHHTTDTDFPVTKFSLFTFWWACAELTSCLEITMYKIFNAILLSNIVHLLSDI